jgi:hypothetical protein
VLQAHLDSFEAPEPVVSKKNPDEIALDDATAPEPVEPSATAATSVEEEEAPRRTPPESHRPRPVQRLMFDETTAATIPGGDQFVATWSEEHEAQLAKAAEELQNRGPVSAQSDALTPESEPAATPAFMEPQMIDDLPAELKPHFRRIERYVQMILFCDLHHFCHQYGIQSYGFFAHE